jgi:hypothetical protein
MNSNIVADALRETLQQRGNTARVYHHKVVETDHRGQTIVTIKIARHWVIDYVKDRYKTGHAVRLRHLHYSSEVDHNIVWRNHNGETETRLYKYRSALPQTTRNFIARNIRLMVQWVSESMPNVPNLYSPFTVMVDVSATNRIIYNTSTVGERLVSIAKVGQWGEYILASIDGNKCRFSPDYVQCEHPKCVVLYVKANHKLIEQFVTGELPCQHSIT